MIRVDAGTRHALAWCTECPSWRTLTADRRAALIAGAAHTAAVHDDPREAAKLAERAANLKPTQG